MCLANPRESTVAELLAEKLELDNIDNAYNVRIKEMSGIQTSRCARKLSRKDMKNHRQRAKNKNDRTQWHIHIIQGKSQGEISRTQSHEECLRLRKEVTCRFDLGGALGGQLPKGCRERKCAKSFVSFASRSPVVGMMCQLLAILISGSMALSPGMFCGRKAGRRRFVRGASKIQIVIKTLGGWA